MHTNELFDRVLSLRSALKRTYVDPEEIEIENPNDPDEEGLCYILCEIMEDIRNIIENIDYHSSPIVTEGVLRKNEIGRYELNGREFTCGRCLEVLIPASDYRPAYWTYCRIEGNEHGYFLVGYPNLSIDGLRARLR